MARGFAGYIMEEHRKLEEELLADAYLKCRNTYRSKNRKDEKLFENVRFKEKKE